MSGGDASAAGAAVRKDGEQRNTGLTGKKEGKTMELDVKDDLKGTDAAPPVRRSARRGSSANVPRIPRGDVWLDRDVAEYLHVCVRTVKRIANEGPRPGELDLRLARPVYVGDRRWFAENVKVLVKGAAKTKAKGTAR